MKQKAKRKYTRKAAPTPAAARAEAKPATPEGYQDVGGMRIEDGDLLTVSPNWVGILRRTGR